LIAYIGIINNKNEATGFYVDDKGTLIDSKDTSFKIQGYVDPSTFTSKVDAVGSVSKTLPADFKPIQTRDEQLLALVNTGAGTSGGKGGGTSGSAGNVSISTGGTGTGNTGNVTIGNATTGNATTGNATTGNATTGNATTGNATTGNATTGNATTGTGNVVVAGGGKGGGTENVTLITNPILSGKTTGKTGLDNDRVDTDTKTLPEVVVTGNLDEEEPLDDTKTTEDDSTKSKTNDTILLSLLNKPLQKSFPFGSSPTQTNASPGSQALAQALRVGDAGAPVFGGDKDKSKRSGWNRESLRYMGNSGDSNG